MPFIEVHYIVDCIYKKKKRAPELFDDFNEIRINGKLAADENEMIKR